MSPWSRSSTVGVALALALGLPGGHQPGPDLSSKNTRRPQTGRGRGAVPSLAPRTAAAPRPYDKPRERLAFAARKRAPAGQRAIPTERYRIAREHAARMPAYSTREGRFAARSGPTEPGASSLEAPVPNLGTWGSLGPGNIGGRTRAIAIVPTNPNTMYAGGVAGGVWKTVDGGANWTPVGSGEDGMENLAVASLALKPGDPNTVLAGTGEGFSNLDAVRGAGIFRTTNGGANWTQIESPGTGSDQACEFHYVNDLVYNAAGTRAYAAVGYSGGCDGSHTGGVYRTTDGGSTWTNILKVTVAGGCLDLAYRNDLGDDVLFAACGNEDPDEATGIFKAEAAQAAFPGSGWTDLTAEDPVLQFWTDRLGRVSLAIAPSDPDTIYAIGADFELADFLVLARSVAGGDPFTWTEQSAWNNSTAVGRLLFTNTPFGAGCFGSPSDTNQGWYDNVIAVDPSDPDRIWAGGIDLFRSDDGGVTFGLASFWWADRTNPGDPPTTYTHADQHFLGFAGGNLFVGNDGGIFRTSDLTGQVIEDIADVCEPTGSTVQFTNLNHGYEVTQFYYGAVFPDDQQYFGGTQDNGTVFGTLGAPNDWTELLGGDGGAVAVNPVDPDVLYAENTGLSIQKCELGPLNCGNDPGLWQDATAGINGDNGFLFIAPFVMDPSAPVDAAAANRLWTGGSYVWRTTDGAGLWKKASARLPSGLRVSALAVAPSNPNFVLAGTADGGSAGGTIFRTAIGLTVNGATWASRKPRAGYVSSLAFDPWDANIAYATYSTFGGVHVWKSLNAGATWSPLDGTAPADLPDVPAHSVVVDPTNSNRLYVGTDIGVFVTVDGGVTWARENTGFGNVVTEQLVISGANLYAFTHGRGVSKVPLTNALQAVLVEFEQPKTEVEETAVNQIVNVRLRTSDHAVLGGAVSIDLRAIEGSARAGTDYQPPSPNPKTIVFPAGTAHDHIEGLVLPIVDDEIGEPAQDFTLTLENPSGVLLGRRTHKVTILADGDPPGLSLNDVTVTEGNSGTTNAVFKLTLSGPARPGTTVTYQTSDGTGTVAGGDYLAAGPVTVPIPTGATTASFSVKVVGNTVAETTKTFFLNILQADSATVDDGQGQATILDNDVSGTVALKSATYPGNEKSPQALITLVRTGGLASGVGVTVETQDGTASSAGGADYQATTSTVTFGAGAKTATFPIPLTNDTIDEPTETVLIRIFGPTGLGAALGPQQTAVLNVADDDAPGQVRFGAATYTAAEGGGVDIKVMRSGGAASAVTVNYTATGSATAGADYTLPAGPLTFGAGETMKTIRLDAVADAAAEGNETVQLALTSPGGGAVVGTPSTTVVTLGDLQPTFAFAVGSVNVKESASSVGLIVRRTGPLASPATVEFTTGDGSAAAGDDYDALSGVLSFPANTPTRSLTVRLRPDALVELPDPQSFQVSLQNPSPGMSLGFLQTATVNIANEDFAGTFFFAQASYTMMESKPAVVLTVKRTGGLAPTTIQYQTTNGTATSPDDYTGTGGNAPLAFAAGKSTALITIPLIQDAFPEGNHSFGVTLTNGGPDGGVIGSPATAGVTVLDDETLATFAAATYKVKEPATGLTSLKIPVKRVGPASTAFTVAYTAGGTASPADYALSPASPLAFAAGELVKEITLTLNTDGLFEGAETVVLTLNPSGAGPGAIPVTTATITDEEPVVFVGSASYNVSEPGGSVPGTAVVTLRRSGNLGQASTVSYAITAGTAQDGLDYQAAGATPASPVTFGIGQSTLLVRVPILPDPEDEPVQTFTLSLSAPVSAALASPTSATVNIGDNDVAGKISLAGTQWSVAEGAGTAIITLTRSGGAAGGASVVCQTGVGTATAGSDYTATAETVTFGPGQKSATCTIPILPNGTPENGESVPVTLGSPSFGVVLGTSSGTLFIADDD